MDRSVSSRSSYLALACTLIGSSCGGQGGEARRPVGMLTPDPARVPDIGMAGRGSSQPIPEGSQASKAPASKAPAVMPPTADATAETDTCEVAQLAAERVTPAIMIVLDRSGSMFSGARWTPSVSAIKRITSELEGIVNFGLTLFPNPTNQPGGADDIEMFSECLATSDPATCLAGRSSEPAEPPGQFGGGAAASCSIGVTVVPVAPANAGAIAWVLDRSTPLGGTPTSQTLETLLDAYTATMPGPDDQRQSQYVLLVTDGHPTCPTGQGRRSTPEDVDASNAAIGELAMNDVRTYVIGYDTSGAGNEELAAVLDGFAVSGATGDLQHRPVENEASLLEEFERITQSIVRCDLDLEEAPAKPDHVLVQLDGETLLLNHENGWELVGDRTIELVGAACERLKDGSHLVDVTVQCAPVGPD